MSISAGSIEPLTACLRDEALGEEELGIALRAAALHLQGRDTEIDKFYLRKVVGEKLRKDVTLQQVLKACCYLLRKAGRNGGATPDTLQQVLLPIGFKPRHVDVLGQCLRQVRDNTLMGVVQISPQSSPQSSPPVYTGDSAVSYNPLQHAPLPGTRVAIKRRGCVSATPATADRIQNIAAKRSGSEVAGQMELARRALIEVARSTDNDETWNVDLDKPLLKAEEALLYAQIFLIDAAPGVNTHRLRRQERELLEIFRRVSDDRARVQGEDGRKSTSVGAEEGFGQKLASVAAAFANGSKQKKSPPPQTSLQDQLSQL